MVLMEHARFYLQFRWAAIRAVVNFLSPRDDTGVRRCYSNGAAHYNGDAISPTRQLIAGERRIWLFGASANRIERGGDIRAARSAVQ